MLRKLKSFVKIKGSAISATQSSQPSAEDPFQTRGDELSQNGDYNGAVVMYGEALRTRKTDPVLLLSRSLAHMMSTPPRLDLALQDADTAVRYDSSNWQGWLQKGECHSKNGDINQAEEAFVKAVTFAQGKDKLVAQTSLGGVRARRGQVLSATESSSASVQSTPLTNPSIGRRNPPAITPPALNSRNNDVSSRPSALTSGTPSQSQYIPSGTPPVPTTRVPIPRANNESSVSQTPATSLPLELEDLVGLTPEPPPGYSPNITSSDPSVRTLSLTTRLTQLTTSLASKTKGSLTIRPYTAPGGIDAVRLLYVGMTILELTDRELGTLTFLHPSFCKYIFLITIHYIHRCPGDMTVNALDYPGNTYLDMDMESSKLYEGKIPGTVNISGYSEEYRDQQLSILPLLNITLEGNTVIPLMALDKIVDRIRLLQRQTTLEDNKTLGEILGLSQYVNQHTVPCFRTYQLCRRLTTLQSGFYANTGRQRQIEAICMGITRSRYMAPTRFIDFSKAKNISHHVFDTQGIGLRNFLFQILLGAELLIRLRKEPLLTSYVAIINDPISALMVLSDLWMRNVTIQGPNTPSTAISSASNATISPPSPEYLLVATRHQHQSRGLIQFAEALAWPYMGEARDFIENAYQNLILNGFKAIDPDICDWLYGLTLPGKTFRHRIICCLVYASPSVRSIGPAPLYDNGLVVKNKSYWPKRSVLGRVLGGLKDSKSVCGWVGPVPAPEGNVSGWIRLNASRVNIPVPASTPLQPSLQDLGFGSTDDAGTPEEVFQSVTDPNDWIPASPPSRPANDTSRSVLKKIQLVEIPPINPTAIISVGKEYRASLEFEVNGTLTRYTLYSTPIFVYAPPCVGTHPLHKLQAQNYLRNIVKVADLAEAYPPSGELVIIDALGQGEEVVARAWCAERAKHAVIRRDSECCFACATAVATKRSGVGFNVLIWSR
jgi:hypothetical protein